MLRPRIIALFRPYRAQLALIVAAILVSSALSVVSALLVRAVFDDALFASGGPDVALLELLVAALVAIPLVTGVLSVAQTYLTNVVGNKVMQDLRDRLFAHLEQLSLAFYTATRSGEVQSRLANDVGGVQTTITSTASSVVSNVVVVASTLVAMLILSVPLTVLSLILVPVFVVLSTRVGRRRRVARGRTQASLADMSSITQEALSVSGILLAKVFGRQEREVARYRAANAQQAELQVRQAMVGRSFFALTQAFFGISPALVYLVAGLQLDHGSAAISAGTLVAFTTLQTRLLMPINQLLQVSVDVQSSLALFGRVFELLDLEPGLRDAPGAATLDPADRARRRRVGARVLPLRRQRARRRARGGGRPPRRARGPGRCTTSRCASSRGSWPRSSGPAAPGRRRSATSSRACTTSRRAPSASTATTCARSPRPRSPSVCGVVTQESYLFGGTVRENLRYGRPDATDEEVEAAARAAFIHDRCSPSTTATTPWSASGATASRAASASGWPSRG